MKKTKLAQTIILSEDPVVDTEAFREELVRHIPLILKKQTNSLPVTNHEAQLWKGDFYGLLLSKNVKPHQLFLLTVLNGYTCSSDFDGNINSIIIPDYDFVDTLLNTHKTIFR